MGPKPIVYQSRRDAKLTHTCLFLMLICLAVAIFGNIFRLNAILDETQDHLNAVQVIMTRESNHPYPQYLNDQNLLMQRYQYDLAHIHIFGLRY